MKAPIIAGALAAAGLFAGLVAGQPLKLKREIVTEVAYTTVEVRVYVDENGTPLKTETVDKVTSVQTTITESFAATSSSTVAAPSSSASPAPVTPAEVAPAPSSTIVSSTSTVAAAVHVESAPPSKVESPAAPTLTPEAKETPAPQPAPEPQPSTPAPAEPEPSKAPKPKAASADQFPIGVTYDPFAEGHQCKSDSQMESEFEKMSQYGMVRIYGQGCNVIPKAIKAAKKYNQRIMAGIYMPLETIDEIAKALSEAVNQYAGGDWSIVAALSVENEQVISGQMSASGAVDSINSARQAFGAVGYNGPIGAVEVVDSVLNNPSICQSADLTLVNIHPFFDTHVTAEGSGKFVRDQVKRLEAKCPGKRVVVTESGWPHQGNNHDNAIVSREKQKAAIDSILAEFDHDLFLFNAFDSLWKSDNPATFNAEKYWGFL
ncbi:glycoside hydrolase family 17 protein [Amniculicola lignicola CBS 123094]|uniref:Glycoside hydrolase family 17 protein n=1 Tax=Amniculicola lignicola CBS 123094 TaxID=1392246 RepID=A0A6A5WHU0_9PLEO|nr:glycoside hydrolase family 17 protein [Amniculicola lignicola CBS 123094]